MAKSGVIDEITAHGALEGLPDVWAELACGRIGPAEALEQARGAEPSELAERTARMLTPPTTAQAKLRLEALLEHVPERPVVTPLRAARSRRWLSGGVAALAAAAAVLLVVVSRDPSRPPFEGEYGLELHRSLAVERGPGSEPAASEVHRYRIDRTIEIALRPGHRIAEAVDVRAFAQRGDEAPIVLPIEPHRKGGGVVEILGQPRDWGLSPGRWQLTFVVGPPGGLPDALAGVSHDADAPYDVRSAWIEIEERAPQAP